jgi:hypothetical protein
MGWKEKDIRVAVIFGPGRQFRPVWFDWRQRKYAVSTVAHSWREQRGGATILHFAVSDGINLFELAYDTVAQTWALNGTESMHYDNSPH